MASLAFNDGSFAVRSRYTRVRTAPAGAPIRKVHVPATKSGVTGSAQKSAAKSSRINTPAHLKPRLVFVFTCGSRPHTVQIQCLQNPPGKIGIQKMCPTSNVRICTDRRAAPHTRQ